MKEQSVADSDTSQEFVAEIEKTQHMKDEALRLALEALERADKISGYPNHKKTIAKIKQALEQPEPKPCGWYVDFGNQDEPNYFSKTKPDEPRALVIPLYTFPLKEKNT